MPGDKVIFSSFCKLGFLKTAHFLKNANDSHRGIAPQVPLLRSGGQKRELDVKGKEGKTGIELLLTL